MLGAGIAFSVVPAAQLEAAPANSAIEKTKSEILTMSATIDDQIIKIRDLSDRIVEVEREITTNEEAIAEFTHSIEETVRETEETKTDLDEKTQVYGRRLREVYKSGNTSAIGTLLGAESLSDLLLRYKVVRNIAKHDKALVDAIEELKRTLEEKTEELKTSRNELEKTTVELKDNKAELGQVKDEQQSELTSMKKEQEKLRQLLRDQEVALFADIEKVLGAESSTEQEVSDALAILATIQSQISTAEAKEHGRKLERDGRSLLDELKEARLEAERLAREKAEAERKARELEAKRLKAKKEEDARKLAAEKKKAEELAAQKDREQKEAEAKAERLEEEQKASEAAAKASKLAASEPVKKTETKPSSTQTTNMTFKLTFYTDLPEDNGGWTITATGDKLTYGVVANNVFPFYTKIYLEGYGTMTVKDRGGSNFNTRSRLDVFIPRKSGESNTTYRNRVYSMGIRTVQGRVLD